MNVFVDTSVWSLALRRTPPSSAPEARFLEACLRRGDLVVVTGLVLQELLQGFRGPRARKAILRNFSLLPTIIPEKDDHVEAAGLRNHCQRRGVRIGTIDALIAQLCIRHDLQLLTTDRDFDAVSRYRPLSLVRL